MGLIKAAASAIGSTLHDEWKEAIRCEDMTNDVLMIKKTSPTGVISNGSTIIVAPGQCAVIYDNGRVIDATAEEGVFVFDTSSTPSFFAGQFKESFKEMWQRFTYNGATAKEQYVFYFNIQEILNNKFGTATPIPFQDWSHPIPNRMTNTLTPLSVQVRCYGTYTFKINEIATFMNEIAGTADIYRKEEITEQIRSEVMASFQNVLNELGTAEHKIPVLELPSQTDEIKEIMDEKIYDANIRKRGLKLVSFSVESVSLEDESKNKINEYELGSNTYMQQGKLTNAYSNAVEGAANNANGAANGFVGVGMMNMASNGMMGGTANGAWQNTEGNTQNVNPFVTNDEQPKTVSEPAKEETQAASEENLEKTSEAENKVNNDNEETQSANNSASGNKKMCLKCGNINPSESKFCNNCGNQL